MKKIIVAIAVLIILSCSAFALLRSPKEADATITAEQKKRDKEAEEYYRKQGYSKKDIEEAKAWLENEFTALKNMPRESAPIEPKFR